MLESKKGEYISPVKNILMSNGKRKGTTWMHWGKEGNYLDTLGKGRELHGCTGERKGTTWIHWGKEGNPMDALGKGRELHGYTGE